MSIEFYETNAQAFFDRSVAADMAQGHAEFVALLPPGGRVLDAGCGSGRDALEFHRRGFRVTAMEAKPFDGSNREQSAREEKWAS